MPKEDIVLYGVAEDVEAGTEWLAKTGKVYAGAV